MNDQPRALFDCPHGVPVNYLCSDCNLGNIPTNTVTPTDVNAVLTERGSLYGAFVTHAEITQEFKTMTHGFLSQRQKLLAADQQEALDMIFHKIGRILNGDPDYADSWMDIAGYAKLVADRLEGITR